MKVKIEEIQNGFLVDVTTDDGLVGKAKCYKYTEIIKLLEEVGEQINGGKKVKVEEK